MVKWCRETETLFQIDSVAPNKWKTAFYCFIWSEIMPAEVNVSYNVTQYIFRNKNEAWSSTHTHTYKYITFAAINPVLCITVVKRVRGAAMVFLLQLQAI